MKRRFIFLVTSLLLTIILILNIISSSFQNEKTELILKEIKRTQDYNANLATVSKSYQQAIIFFDIENISDYNNCDKISYGDYITCKSLDSARTLEKLKITDEMRYFYFNDDFIKTIDLKYDWTFWLDVIKYILLIVAVLSGFYIFMFAKDKEI